MKMRLCLNYGEESIEDVLLCAHQPACMNLTVCWFGQSMGEEGGLKGCSRRKGHVQHLEKYELL